MITGMVLPIIAYGDPVLRKKGVEITKDFPDLEKLIDDMFETMEKSRGVGLAARSVIKYSQLECHQDPLAQQT